MKGLSVVTWSIVLLAATGWGQDPSSPPVPAFGSDTDVSSSELPYTEALQPPIPVRGMQMPLTFSSDTERSNFVMGSLRFAAGFDDNVLGTSSGHVSDMTYMILPSVDVGQSRERWTWDFGYSPGFTMSQRLTQTNEAAQALHLLFAYRLSPHITAQIRDNFEKTNSLFSGVLDNTAVAGPGPLQQSNPSVVTPQVERTGNSSGLDLTYQVGANSLVGASGYFYFVNYGRPASVAGQTYALIDSRSEGGDSFYAHRFSNRHWLGLTYNFQRLLFDPGDQTDVNRALFFYSISGESPITFSIWAGPERATSVIPGSLTTGNSPASSATRWNPATGAILSWQGRRTSFRVEYSRQTSDGGGLAQAVRLQGVDGEVRQRLSPRWTFSVGSGYGKNNPLNAALGYPPYHSIRSNAGFEYVLTDSLQFGFHYGRDQLTYDYPSSVQLSSNRNRAWFSASYSFSRPLGR
jgi:hypothetical protein